VQYQSTRRDGLVCNRQRIERNSRIHATGQHKIWLMEPPHAYPHYQRYASCNYPAWATL